MANDLSFIVLHHHVPSAQSNGFSSFPGFYLALSSSSTGFMTIYPKVYHHVPSIFHVYHGFPSIFPPFSTMFIFPAVVHLGPRGHNSSLPIFTRTVLSTVEPFDEVMEGAAEILSHAEGARFAPSESTLRVLGWWSGGPIGG